MCRVKLYTLTHSLSLKIVAAKKIDISVSALISANLFQTNKHTDVGYHRTSATSLAEVITVDYIAVWLKQTDRQTERQTVYH